MLELRWILGITVLVLAAAVASRMRMAAAQRHAIWTGVLALALVLPFLPRWTPPVETIAGQSVIGIQRVILTVTPAAASQTAPDWPRYLWWAGMAAIAAWWLAGFVRVAGMVAASKEYSTFEGVAVRTCAGLRMPAVALGPVILIPDSAASWPAGRLAMVLTHELGHVRRWDLLWRLIGLVACCVYWFHPLAWWALAQQRRESEMSCDDQVLQSSGEPAVYAESLLAVAREASGHPAPAAVMAMAKPNELEGRLLAVLDSARPRRGSAWLTAVATFALGLAMVMPLNAWQDASGAQMKGTVRDIVGVIPGAKIVLKLDGNGSEYEFESGPDGAYAVKGLPEGTYTVEILKPGYARNSLGKLAIGTKTRLADFHLELGRIRETLTVDGGKSEAVTSAANDAPKRVRVSGNIQAAKLLKRVSPVYPKEAKAAGVQGTVRMQMVVSKEGDVMNLTLLTSPSAELARSAMEAVNQWKYSPTLLNGNPVEIQTIVDINYTLAP